MANWVPAEAVCTTACTDGLVLVTATLGCDTAGTAASVIDARLLKEACHTGGLKIAWLGFAEDRVRADVGFAAAVVVELVAKIAGLVLVTAKLGLGTAASVVGARFLSQA